jgi:hypothetical protein
MKKNKLHKVPLSLKPFNCFFFPFPEPSPPSPLQNSKQTLKIEVVASTTNYFGTQLFQTNIKSVLKVIWNEFDYVKLTSYNWVYACLDLWWNWQNHNESSQFFNSYTLELQQNHGATLILSNSPPIQKITAIFPTKLFSCTNFSTQHKCHFTWFLAE